MPSVTDLARSLARSSVSLATGTVREAAAVASTVAPMAVPPIRTVVAAVQDGGRKVEAAAQAATDQALRQTIRRVADVAMQVLDLTAIVRDHVDLDAVVAAVDLDAVVDRIDLDAVVARVDIDRIIGRLDLDAVADRIDIGRQIDRVDLNSVAGRIDLDGLAGELDLNALAGRIDLDPLVAGVDVDAVVAKVDLDQVIRRLDLNALAREVIAAIDLPAIIRESTGALSSEMVRDFRAQSRSADDAVAGFVSRLFGRRDQAPDGT